MCWMRWAAMEPHLHNHKSTMSTAQHFESPNSPPEWHSSRARLYQRPLQAAQLSGGGSRPSSFGAGFARKHFFSVSCLSRSPSSARSADRNDGP